MILAECNVKIPSQKPIKVDGFLQPIEELGQKGYHLEDQFPDSKNLDVFYRYPAPGDALNNRPNDGAECSLIACRRRFEVPEVLEFKGQVDRRLHRCFRIDVAKGQPVSIS